MGPRAREPCATAWRTSPPLALRSGSIQSSNSNLACTNTCSGRTGRWCRVRVLVLGGTGMLGHKVVQAVRDRFPDTWCTVRGRATDPGLPGAFNDTSRVIEEVDMLDWSRVESAIRGIRPEVVVNCVGIVK